MGWRVHERERSELAAELVKNAIKTEDANPHVLALHQDNGGPMKGATLKANFEALGVMASYSRPRVSDDNPFSEALFRTLKYRPGYPRSNRSAMANEPTHLFFTEGPSRDLTPMWMIRMLVRSSVEQTLATSD